MTFLRDWMGSAEQAFFKRDFFKISPENRNLTHSLRLKKVLAN